MAHPIKKNIVYLVLYFCLTLLTCFLVEIFRFEWSVISNYKSSQTIFVTIWICILLFVIYLILKKTGIDPTQFGVYSFIFGPFILLVGFIFSLAIGSDAHSLIERNYTGIYGITEVENADGDGLNTYYHNTYVFRKNDNSLDHERNRLDEEFADGSSTENFIFWETALAEGFEPRNISNYECCTAFSQKLKLYLTVGPLSIVECLIRALIPSLFLILIPLIGLIFKRRLFFSNMNDLRNIFKPFPPE